MSPERREAPPPPDLRTIEWTDLGRLVSWNHGTNIINEANQKSIFGQGNDGAGFEKSSCDPIEVVWVQTSPTKKRLMIKDGHHRAKGVYQYREQIDRKYDGEFRLSLRNMTSIALRNQGFEVPETDYAVPFTEQDVEMESPTGEGPIALTPEQYVISLLPATRKQKEIAPLRSAAHLMVAWDSFIGSEELGKKFSALAGLALLDQRSFESRNTESVETYLEGINTFFEDNTPAEQWQVRRAVTSMHNVLKQVEVSPGEAARAAFTIACQQPDAVGGRAQAFAQIAGLMYQPSILRKITQDYSEGDGLRFGIRILADRTRQALAKTDLKAVFGKSPSDQIYKALTDQRLDFRQTVAILEAKSPEAEHAKVIARIRSNALEQAYLDTTDHDRATGTERIVIEKIAKGEDMFGSFRVSSEVTTVTRALEALASYTSVVAQVDASDLPEEDKANTKRRLLTASKAVIGGNKQIQSAMGTLRRLCDEVSKGLEKPKPERVVYHREGTPHATFRRGLSTLLGAPKDVPISDDLPSINAALEALTDMRNQLTEPLATPASPPTPESEPIDREALIDEVLSQLRELPPAARASVIEGKRSLPAAMAEWVHNRAAVENPQAQKLLADALQNILFAAMMLPDIKAVDPRIRPLIPDVLSYLASLRQRPQ